MNRSYSKIRHINESNIILENRRNLIKETEEETKTKFDFSQTDRKLLSDFFTMKQGFNYVTNKDGIEIYQLKKNGFSLLVGTKESNDPSMLELMIFVDFPMGKRINYLGEVKGISKAKVGMNEYGKITELLQGALDFGRAQSDYDNLPPLPKF